MKTKPIPAPFTPLRTPKFTDGKFTTHPYVPAIATDITETFERVRAQMRKANRKRINRS